jgi:hypothetical protein
MERYEAKLLLRLEGDALRQVRTAAKKNGLSVSEFCRRALSAHVAGQATPGAALFLKRGGGYEFYGEVKPAKVRIVKRMVERRT